MTIFKEEGQWYAWKCSNCMDLLKIRQEHGYIQTDAKKIPADMWYVLDTNNKTEKE